MLLLPFLFTVVFLIYATVPSNFTKVPHGFLLAINKFFDVLLNCTIFTLSFDRSLESKNGTFKCSFSLMDYIVVRNSIQVSSDSTIDEK